MSSALDLAHTSPRAHFTGRTLDSREKSSEWPQFTAASRGPEGLLSRSDRRTVTNPNLTIPTPTDDKTPGSVSANVSPHIPQGPQGSASSRRGSPHSLLDGLSSATRSVPATPLGLTSAAAAHLLKTPGTPLTPDSQLLSGRIPTPGSHTLNDGGNDLQASLSRLPTDQYDPSSLAFGSLQSGSIDDVSAMLSFCRFTLNRSSPRMQWIPCIPLTARSKAIDMLVTTSILQPVALSPLMLIVIRPAQPRFITTMGLVMV
jgi:hypothetical protein